MSAEGVATGTIDIAFDNGGGTFGLPSWEGKLHDVTLDSSGDRLALSFSFSFSTSTGYGPVRFDLWRCLK